MGTMMHMQSEEVREVLIREEARLQQMTSGLREDGELDLTVQEESGGELSNVDQHSADTASEEVQRSISLSMIEQLEAELSDIERALRKLDEGNYGTCEACRNPIDAQRLEVLPATRYCLQDQAAAEKETSGQSATSEYVGESIPRQGLPGNSAPI